MPQPHSLGAFGQDGQRKLIQSESCQGGTGSGKETQPHWRVQRSSRLSNTSLTSTLGPPTAETTALSAGGREGCRPHRGPPLDRILDDHTLGWTWWQRGEDHHFLSMFCRLGAGQLCIYHPMSSFQSSHWIRMSYFHFTNEKAEARRSHLFT